MRGFFLSRKHISTLYDMRWLALIAVFFFSSVGSAAAGYSESMDFSMLTSTEEHASPDPHCGEANSHTAHPSLWCTIECLKGATTLPSMADTTPLLLLLPLILILAVATIPKQNLLAFSPVFSAPPPDRITALLSVMRRE